MSRLARPAARLADGSAAVARGLGRRTAAWVARGRRQDLTGWRATLGCWLRLAVLALGVYLLWRIVRAVPQLMWALTGVWVIAAWRAGREAPAEAEEGIEEEPPRASPDDVRAATLDWIRRRIGDAQGVHLRDLLAHAQEHGMFEGMDVATFRAHLERWGIPVRSRCRVRGLGVTVGIHRDDLQAPSEASPEQKPQGETETELHAA
ncbi:hypothetical protein E2C11_16505 [Streptomyces lavendulae]|nr:hypothetical protein [Streptomyces lavendulae]TXJ78607.1 hypothetical protein E2C11_16505 [Streptomyces lavendulae]